MNKKTYDISLLIGLALVGGGAAAAWGTPIALVITGALVVALTLWGAR